MKSISIWKAKTNPNSDSTNPNTDLWETFSKLLKNNFLKLEEHLQNEELGKW